MKRIICVTLLLSFAAVLAVSAGIASTRQPEPLRIFLRGGPKTHGPAGNGLHDHEVWLKDWQPLLASRGATVDGALQFPTAAQLDNADVRLIPQIWVYENQLEGGKPYRAYVNLLGHHYRTFSSPHVRGTLLRGIAWAGRRDADSLATPEEIAALR